MLLFSGCSIGRAAPQPFNTPTYEPGVATTPAADTAENADDTAPAMPSPAVPDASRANSPDGAWVYTGEIEPEDEVAIVSEVEGQVLELHIEVGDRVTAGQVLLRIDSTMLEARRAQALADLEAAQAQLDLIQVEANAEDIEAARAVVAAADAAYKRALEGPTTEDLTMAEAQLRQAEAAVTRAQAAYDQVSWNPLIAALPESQALQQATLALEAAQAHYDKLAKGSAEEVIAAAYAQVAQARARLQQLEEGANPAQIQAAEAQVRQAETALYLAQLQLDKATVRAPIDGRVAQVNTATGAMALPGAPVARLLTPEVKIVVPVEESRLAQLHAGQQARIRVNAYPDRVFTGEVAIIAPQLDPTSRTVQVTVRPTDDALLLSPGMLATVELLP